MANNTNSSPLKCNDDWLIIPLMSTADAVNLYVIGVLQILFGIASVLFNSMAIAAINNIQRDDKHYTVLLHLCAADLLSNLTTQATYTAILFMEASGTGRDSLCVISKFINISGLFLCFASFSLLLLATAERCFAIFMPFRYERYKASKITLLLVLLVWIFSATVTALHEIPALSKSWALFLLGFLILGGVFISVAHATILCMAYRVRKQIQKLSMLTTIRKKSDSCSISQAENTVCTQDSFNMSQATVKTPKNSINTTTQESLAPAGVVKHCLTTSKTLAMLRHNSQTTSRSDVVQSNESKSNGRLPEVTNQTGNRFENTSKVSSQNTATIEMTIDRSQVPKDNSLNHSNAVRGTPKRKSNKSRPASPQRRLSLAKVTAVLCATCLICYIPFVICVALYKLKMIISRLLLHWMWTLLLLSSTLTPVLFGFLNNELRRKILKICKINNLED